MEARREYRDMSTDGSHEACVVIVAPRHDARHTSGPIAPLAVEKAAQETAALIAVGDRTRVLLLIDHRDARGAHLHETRSGRLLIGWLDVRGAERLEKFLDGSLRAYQRGRRRAYPRCDTVRQHEQD